MALVDQAKGFFSSKLNWLGILTFIIGLADLKDQIPPGAAKVLLLVVGIATIALRTFFTSKPIQIGAPASLN